MCLFQVIITILKIHAVKSNSDEPYEIMAKVLKHQQTVGHERSISKIPAHLRALKHLRNVYFSFALPKRLSP